MAAVTNNLESVGLDSVELEKSGVEVDVGSIHGLAGPAATARSVGASHSNLTKSVWMRSLLEKELSVRKYELRRSDKGEYFFIVTPSLPASLIPWAPAMHDDQCRFALWSENNEKMACPAFSLPAGGLLTGGSCPGADAAQTVTPVAQRSARLESHPDGHYLRARAPGGVAVPMREGLTICSRCYAEVQGASFTRTNNQFRVVLCYWWLRQSLAARRMDWLVDIFVDSIKHLSFGSERHRIQPIRLHDSGDFFSADYAEMWCRVADRLAVEMPAVVLWAPTRTWAQGGWSEFWTKRLGALASLRTIGRPNLVIRASGYNFGDAAPGQMHHTNAKGTTSLFKPSARVQDFLRNRTDPMKVARPGAAEPRADWNCQVYGADETSCTHAMAPDGKKGCRACWLHPELSVNYTSH